MEKHESECLKLKTEYAQIEKLQKEFELELEKAIQSGKTEKTKELKIQIEEKLKNLKEKIIPKEISASYTNPETSEQKEIRINIVQMIREQREFHKKHNLPVFNEQEIRQIFRKHKAEIQKEMETYGYDTILIIPENLPDTESLHQKMSAGYNETYQNNNFKEGGSFAGTKTSESKKTRIILTHPDQNIYENDQANPFLKATLDKDIMQLSGLTEPEINQRIQSNQPIPINFETAINGKTIKIQSEGLSLDEYLLFQRQYFEKTQKHLDEKGWIWLLKSRSGSRVAVAHWYPADGRLNVSADVPGISSGLLGCRLSRSFELA
jgi:hypothetical protein